MSNISIKKPGNSVLVGALAPVGSRDETPAIKGISHFIEHMAFKGTAKRDKYQLKSEIEQYGATFNAYTAEECTFYYVEIAKKYAEVARDVINDMVHNPAFPVEEINSERKVILQELQMHEDNPQSHIFELSQKAIFQPTSGLHLPIIGTRESLANIDRAELSAYHNHMYKNIITLEVGDIEEVEAQMLLPHKFAPEVPNSDRSDYIVSRPGINQANMILTGLIHFSDPITAKFDMEFYSGLLNGFTGRLFQVIREKHGLVYTVAFYYQIFSCGTVQYHVYAALDPDKIQMAKNLMIQELTRPVTPEEVNYVQKKITGEHDLAIDSKYYLSRLIIESTINHGNYSNIIKKYEDNINLSAKSVNDFIAYAPFEKSKLVAIIPEK